MAEQTTFIEQFVDPGLGNSAYLVGSHETQTALLIDPLRDVDRYRYAAERLGLASSSAMIPMDGPVAVSCASGSRSMAGISVLARHGYTNLIQVAGGFDAWEQAGFEAER